MNSRFTHTLCLLLTSLVLPLVSIANQPNIILIYVDDLGYNDLGCFGSELIKTPHLDQMATEGMKLTSYYNGAPLCGPSRLSLMTGCYPLRPAIHQVNQERQYHPVLHNEEVTMPEVLKSAGYATMLIGKWHLSGNSRIAIGGNLDGAKPFYMKRPHLMPQAQGFDQYFGIPYSNDMNPSVLMRNGEFIESPVNQVGITTRYTDEALHFVEQNQDRPFFLLLAHNMPHTPLYPAEEFEGKSAYGLYGDCVEEIDHNVGRILAKLQQLKIDDNTLVIFTSDNGPWIEPHPNPERNRTPEMRTSRLQSGTAAPLRGMKMTSWEGGPRVPFIARYPGVIPANRESDALTTSMDLYPTFTDLAGTTLPQNRVIDGRDVLPLLTGKTNRSAHEYYLYYQYTHLLAIRDHRYKLVLPRDELIPLIGWYGRLSEGIAEPQLFDLKADLSETTDISAQHPDIVTRLLAQAEIAKKDLGSFDRQGNGWRGDYRWENDWIRTLDGKVKRDSN